MAQTFNQDQTAVVRPRAAGFDVQRAEKNSAVCSALLSGVHIVRTALHPGCILVAPGCGRIGWSSMSSSKAIFRGASVHCYDLFVLSFLVTVVLK